MRLQKNEPARDGHEEKGKQKLGFVGRDKPPEPKQEMTVSPIHMDPFLVVRLLRHHLGVAPFRFGVLLAQSSDNSF